MKKKSTVLTEEELARNRLAAARCAIDQGYINVDEIFSPDELAEYLRGLSMDE